jgi:hypothetical protein
MSPATSVADTFSKVSVSFALPTLARLTRRGAKAGLRTAFLVGTVLTAAFSLSSGAHAQNYVGQAGVANVTALSLVGLNVLNTGALPSTGGSLGTLTLPVNVEVGIPPITTAVLLDATTSFANTVGQNGSVTSNTSISAASLLGLEVLTIPSDPLVSVGALVSHAYADANGTFGYSKITDLRVGGQVVNFATIDINGEIYAAPNQTLNVAGVKLTINEQKTESGVLIVNALRVEASPLTIGVADITLGSTRAGFTPAITPGAAAPEPGTLALLGIGGLGMVGVVARKRKIS